MFNLITDKKTSEAMSVITDPFLKDKIKSIWLYLSTSSGNARWNGWIEFKHGNTSGKQEIQSTPDFADAVAQLKAIIDSIK